jgi:hypothetical protein
VSFKMSIRRCRDCHIKHREVVFQSNLINSDKIEHFTATFKECLYSYFSDLNYKYLDVNNDFTMYTDISQSGNSLVEYSHLTLERDLIINTVYS